MSNDGKRYPNNLPSNGPGSGNEKQSLFSIKRIFGMIFSGKFKSDSRKKINSKGYQDYIDESEVSDTSYYFDKDSFSIVERTPTFGDNSPIVVTPLVSQNYNTFKDIVSSNIGDNFSKLNDSTYIEILKEFMQKHSLTFSRYSDHRNVHISLANAAFIIASNYTYLEPFIHHLKAHINDSTIQYPQAKASESELAAVIFLCRQLKKLYFFENFSFLKGKVLSIKVNLNSDYIKFITGKWFEIYVSQLANFFALYVFQHKKIPCVVLSNVTLADPASERLEYELDVVILTPYNMYIIECKTKKFISCIPKYQKLAEKLDIPTKSIFIVAGNMSQEQSIKFTKTYDMNICNYDSLLVLLMSSFEDVLNRNSRSISE